MSANRIAAVVSTIVIAGLGLSACTSTKTTTGQPHNSVGSTPASSGSTSHPTSSPAVSSSTAASGQPVHIKLLEDDSYGAPTYGIGMPIVAYFSKKITEARDFTKATTITVNGQPNAGSWYFESSAIIKGYPIEAHFRPAPEAGSTDAYWPAHASIHMDMKTQGVSAGPGLIFDDSLTLSMATGAAHISTVNCSAGVEKMVVTSDGKTVNTFPTSCGAAKTPTYTGVKVVMQKGEQAPGKSTLRTDGAVEMIGTSHSDRYDLIVPWSVRITQSGEYVHAASWNGGNIGQRSTSNGCTNLNTNDAKWFYSFAVIGDVLNYSGTGGIKMPVWDGFGDWNVPQAVWNTGGLVPTT